MPSPSGPPSPPFGASCPTLTMRLPSTSAARTLPLLMSRCQTRLACRKRSEHSSCHMMLRTCDMQVMMGVTIVYLGVTGMHGASTAAAK